MSKKNILKHGNSQLNKDNLEVITCCCAVFSGLRQATLVELWTSYTVIIERDENILLRKGN